MRDAEVGDTVLLLNHEHLSAATPYRASHAIFVGEDVATATPAVNGIPGFLRCRLLSARAFDGGGMMRDAKVVPGEALGPVLEALFADEAVDSIHLHNAARGCYLAQVDRVGG